MIYYVKEIDDHFNDMQLKKIILQKLYHIIELLEFDDSDFE